MIVFFLLSGVLLTSYGAWLLHPALGFFILGSWFILLTCLLAFGKKMAEKEKKP